MEEPIIEGKRMPLPKPLKVGMIILTIAGITAFVASFLFTDENIGGMVLITKNGTHISDGVNLSVIYTIIGVIFVTFGLTTFILNNVHRSDYVKVYDDHIEIYNGKTTFTEKICNIDRYVLLNFKDSISFTIKSFSKPIKIYFIENTRKIISFIDDKKSEIYASQMIKK